MSNAYSQPHEGTSRSAMDRLRWALRSLRETVDNVKKSPVSRPMEPRTSAVNATMVEQMGVEV